MCYKTAMNRKTLSRPMKFLRDNGHLKGRILDYGSGKGFDAKEVGADRYDPYYAPGLPLKIYDTITCNYVLNVVSKDEQHRIIGRITEMLGNNPNGGSAYFTVRRDIPKEGKQGKGCWQRYVELPFTRIRSNSQYAIYRMTIR